MVLSRAYNPVLHFDDINGKPLVGGLLYVYYAGTSTLATTYRNGSCIEVNENPVRLDERGECEVWLNQSLKYKFVLKDSLDAVIWESDNVSTGGGSSGTYVPEHFFLKRTATPIDVNSQTYGHTLPIFNINHSEEDKPDYVGDFIHHYEDPDNGGDISYVYLKPGAYRLSTRCRFYFKGERSGIAEIRTYFGSPAQSAWHYVDSSVKDYVSVYDECNFRVPDTVEYQEHYCAFGCDKNVKVWIDEFNITKI